MQTALLNALVNNPKLHPEGANPTVGRRKEVLDIVCPQKAGTIFEAHLKKVLSNDNGLAYLSAGGTKKLARTLSKTLPATQIKKIISLLNDSDISTAEAIELHEKYKIPVSRLEKDLVFVRAEGSWLFDTLGRKYLDMDSNYSATNLESLV